MNPTFLSRLIANTEPVTEASSEGLFSFIHSWFNDPLFVFISGLILLCLFFWYLGSENDRVKRNAGTFFIVGIGTFALFSLLEKGINKGIDINGGVSFTLQVEPKDIDGEMVEPTPDAMNRAVAIVRERIDSTGAKESSVMIQGGTKILVQIPETDPTKIKEQREIITRIAALELLPVHPNNNELVAANQEFVPGYKLYTHTFKDDDGVEHNEKLFLSKRESLTGNDVSYAQPDAIRPGVVNVTLSGKGGDKMIRITQSMAHGRDRLAVVLDGKVVTAPTVQSTLSTQFQISGMDGPGEAVNVARVLSNPLDSPLTILEQRTVSASLGKSALDQGIFAGLGGLVFVFILMLLYYRFAGIVAMMALVVNSLILLGCMSLFDFTLTLPGIAGIILTLGVAVDSNVLIYERLREELDRKRPIVSALRTSFDKAFSAIFDSNITSLITALLLFWMASGSIKGFAVTLTVGIATSMIGALVVTRVIFFWATRAGIVRSNVKFLNIFQKTNYNFLGKRKLCGWASIFAIVFVIAFSAIKGQSAFGIDFTGGSTIIYDVPASIELDFKKVESVVDTIPLSQKAKVLEFLTPSGNTTVTVSCSANEQDMNTIMTTLNKEVPGIAELEKAQGPPSTEMIGPVLGAEFLQSSLKALALGLLGIMIYLTVRYEWTFALGAVIAIFHDVILVIGLIILSGQQLNLIHIGAILTIAGYSINDTIIIFDRIRETILSSEGNESIEVQMNDAVNATLSRTILTSGATLLCIICLWAFGGPSMKDFSYTIFLGVIIGTYSSVFIAAPSVLLFSRKNSLRDEVIKRAKAELADNSQV